MKFSNTIKTVLKIYQKYVKNSVWFGTGEPIIVITDEDSKLKHCACTGGGHKK